MGMATEDVARLLNFTLFYVQVSLSPPKLGPDRFTNSTCWKAFLEKKVYNVFC